MRKGRLALVVIVILVIAVALPVIWYVVIRGSSGAAGGGGLSPSEAQLKASDAAVYAALNSSSFDVRVENRTAFMIQASQDFLSWNVYGNASLLNIGQGTFRLEPLAPQTLNFFSNYSLALQKGLPRHDVADIYMAANLTQNDADTFNCEPIVLQGNYNNMSIVPVPDRLAWDLTQQIKQINEGGFDVQNQKGIGLALNTKAITNEWCIFGDPTGDPSGIAYYSHEPNMKINDSRVSELTNLQWKLFSEFAPIHGEKKTYNDFPWWDSQKLRVNNPDENGLRAQLFNLWYLHPYTFSIKDKNLIFGIEGVKTDLLQSAEQFRAIKSMYPNGMLQTEYMGLRDPRFFFYDEMDDRFHHGSSNTISAFVGGWDDSKVRHGEDIQNNPGYDWIQSQNGPDQFLTRNWPSYDLAKFIIGYLRGKKDLFVKENPLTEIILPSVLRTAGFPTNTHNIYPPLAEGCSIRQGAVGMPQNVAQRLQASYPNVLLGPGNTVSIFSCADGLKKDGAKTLSAEFNDIKVYLMK
ncbi:MAG: hypothetical protein NWE94_04620 [Candidatus Bathyarchaeota archaeon]|nr:hypothetical protein [Candidatus Bathyarchaeota archaeon]